MTITANHSPAQAGDADRSASIRQPACRAAKAAEFRKAVALAAQLAAELHAAAPSIGLDVAARVESNLFLGRAAYTELAADLDTGDLWQSPETTADIAAYRFDMELADRTDPIYMVTGSQIADRERAAFEAGRLAAETTT